MNPTFQLFLTSLGNLIVSIIRFFLALFYSGFKLTKAICSLSINLIQKILNRLP